MFKLIQQRAEGTREDYTVLGEPQVLASNHSITELDFDLQYELNSLRKAGAELFKKDEETYLVINSSDQVEKVIAIV